MASKESILRRDLLNQHINESQKRCDEKCDVIDGVDKKVKSSKMKVDNKKTNKNKGMEIKNTFGTPNPNIKNTEDYKFSKQEQSTYTQKDIDNAAKGSWAVNEKEVDRNGYKGTTEDESFNNTQESVQDLQAQVVELNNMRSELLAKEMTEEFQANEEKLREAQRKLENLGEESRALKLAEVNEGTAESKGSEKQERGDEGEFDKMTETETLSEEEFRVAYGQEKEGATENTSTEKAEAQQERLEQLKNALDEARGVFASKNYKNNNAWAHIGKMLGLKKRDAADPDMQIVKESYHKAIKEYQEERLKHVESMSSMAGREFFARDMFKFNAEEAGRLFDGYTEAKMDSVSDSKIMKSVGAVGKFLTESKAGKIMMKTSVALGVISGGVRVALGHMPKIATKFGANETIIAGLEKVALASKFLVPIGAGIAVGGLVEKWQKVRYENKENEEKKKFENMTVDEQMMQLMDFNQDSFDKLMKTMGKRINRRRISVTAGGMTALAAFMMTGDASIENEAVDTVKEISEFDGMSTEELAQEIKYGQSVFSAMSQDFTDEMKGTKAFEMFKEKYDSEAYMKYLQEGGDDSKWQKKVENALKIYTESAKNQLEGSIGTSDATASVSEVVDAEYMKSLEERFNQYGISQEQIQAAKDLPETDRDKMEEYLIRLNQGEAIQNGKVNTELIKQRAQEAFGQYQLTGEVPSVDTITQEPVPEISNDVTGAEYSHEDMLAAEEQSVASEMVDNPIAQSFEGGEITADGNVLLTIGKGGSIENKLIEFLKANHDNLTDGGMGWDVDDPRWGGDMDKWAGSRAHGLAKEFADSHKGFDLDTIQPGTTLEVNVSNPADVKVDIDFKDGPHIVPENEKIVFDKSVPVEPETAEAPTLGEENNVEVKTDVDDNILEKITDTKDVVRAFGMTEAQFAQISDKPVMELLDNATSKQPDEWTPLERTLLELNRPNSGIDISDKTVGEVIDSTNINILKNIVDNQEVSSVQEMGATNIDSSTATDAAEQAGEASQFEGMTESEVLRELGSNREFKVAIAEQMKEIFGAKDITNTLRSVAPSDMSFYLSQEYMGAEKDAVVGLRDRAVSAFGESGNPRPGVKVGEYFTRIFAKAVHEGKVKDVFPSAKFEV